MFLSIARGAAIKRRGPITARPGELPTREQMDEVIRREVCRADRNGHELSLVVFDLGPAAGAAGRPSRAACRLVREAVRRARTTDVVGWFGDGQVCAVLPDTPASGARVFAESVGELTSRHMPRPRAVIYQYPGDSTPAPARARLEIEPVIVRRLPELLDPGRGTNGRALPDRDGHTRRAGHQGNGESHKGATRNGAARDDANNGNGMNGKPQNGNSRKRQLIPDDRRVALAFLPSPTLRPGATRNSGPGAARSQPLAPLMVRPMPKWKRALDVVGAAVGLVLLAPVMAAATLAVLLSGPGPILFTQRRAGLGGRPFTIYKFRTMTADAERQKAALRPLSEQDGPAFKLANDPRVTPLGRLLRRTSVDELPQLWNVLKGDMSLVGPRPLPLDESDGCTHWQRHRLDVTPGLTCTWQVSGRSAVSFAQWVRMDMAYVRRRTLLHDLWILLKTVPAVLLRKGAW